MALTDRQKAKARFHLGYLGVQEAQTFVLGVPAAVQTQFMIEGAFSKLLPESLQDFEEILCRLDDITREVYGGIDLASVEEAGAVKVNRKRFQELGLYYRNARAELANLMGIVPNPFDQRPLVQGGSGAGNVPVG